MISSDLWLAKIISLRAPSLWMASICSLAWKVSIIIYDIHGVGFFSFWVGLPWQVKNPKYRNLIFRFLWIQIPKKLLYIPALDIWSSIYPLNNLSLLLSDDISEWRTGFTEKTVVRPPCSHRFLDWNPLYGPPKSKTKRHYTLKYQLVWSVWIISKN